MTKFIDVLNLLKLAVENGLIEKDPNPFGYKTRKDNLLIYREASSKYPEGWYSENIMNVASELLEDEEGQQTIIDALIENGVEIEKENSALRLKRRIEMKKLLKNTILLNLAAENGLIEKDPNPFKEKNRENNLLISRNSVDIISFAEALTADEEEELINALLSKGVLFSEMEKEVEEILDLLEGKDDGYADRLTLVLKSILTIRERRTLNG